MLFNAEHHAQVPVELYDGDGKLIKGITEIDTVTGVGICFFNLDGPWPNAAISSLNKYVGSNCVEARCLWPLPIKVVSTAGYEVLDENQLMVAICHEQIKKRIGSKFDALAKRQNKAFETLRFVAEMAAYDGGSSAANPYFARLAKKARIG
ncbi:MAG: hypothetical protein ACO3DK_04755 [Bacteroidia bacterium]